MRIGREVRRSFSRFRRGSVDRLKRMLARVSAVPVGKGGDGVDRPIFSAGNEIDPDWGALSLQIENAREAWRKNPLARRFIGLITSYCIGDGVRLASEYGPLHEFIEAFWQHPLNNIDLELPDWSDELARSGELFIALFRNEVDGSIYARAIPSSRIEAVEADPDDYRRELRYKEFSGPGQDDKWWLSPEHPQAVADPDLPVMLHYAVNRPIGALRGASDLAPVLVWLRRYNGWLEDRVRLNAGVRAFLWVVKAPRNLLGELRERYRSPPAPGSVVVADNAGEEWQAVSPNLHAADASRDGRAIRWMIAAGGPGTALTDFGEGEDANLATAKAMGEQKRRFLRRRQRYVIHMLSDLVIHAYTRREGLGGRRGRRLVTPTDIVAHAPDISPEDNHELAAAAASMATALNGMTDLVGNGPAMRRLVLRLFVKFAGVQLSAGEFEKIMAESVGVDQKQ